MVDRVLMESTATLARVWRGTMETIVKRVSFEFQDYLEIHLTRITQLFTRKIVFSSRHPRILSRYLHVKMAYRKTFQGKISPVFFFAFLSLQILTSVPLARV